MDLFDLSAKITLDIGDYISGLKSAESSQEDFASSVEDAGYSVDSLADSIATAQAEYNEAQAQVKQLTAALNEYSAETGGSTSGTQELAYMLAQAQQKADTAASSLKSLKAAQTQEAGASQSAAKSLANFANAIKTGLAGAAVTKAIGVFKDLLEETVAYGDAVDKNSQKLGISAEAYQEWEAVLQHSGTSMSAMTATFRTLSNAVQDGSADQIAAFERLGLSIDELKNMSTEDVFKNVILALQNMESGTERTAIATDLLGRGSMELGALLNQSADETQGMIDRVHELGGVMSEDALASSVEFKDNMQDLTTAMSGLGRDIIADTLPALNGVLETLTNIFASIREYRNEGFDAAASGFEDLANNIKYWSDKASDAQGAIDMYGFEGAAQYISHYGHALDNARDQMDAYLDSAEGQAEVLALVESGELSVQKAAEMAGVSTQEMQRRMRVAADAERGLAEASEDTTESIAEQNTALADIGYAAIDAARSGENLWETYAELTEQLDTLEGVENEQLQLAVEQALAFLELTATTQELTDSYPQLSSAAESAGYSIEGLASRLIANGMTVEEWAAAVSGATDGIINDFELLDTSIGLSLDEMASNLQANIEAQVAWNENIATLMAAAEASGDQNAVAFVQHMQEMGVGAADQVAAMVQDVDGTLATFGPLFGEAAEAGIDSVMLGLGDGESEVTSAAGDVMQSGADEALSVAQAEGPGIGTSLDNGIVTGLISAKASVIAAGIQVMDEAIGAMKARAEIKSPSHVMRDEVGVMLTRGVAVGMTDAAALSEIDRSANDVVGYVTDAFGSAPYAYQFGANSTAAISGTVNNGDIISLLELYLPMLVNRSIAIDGTELVGATVATMDQQLGTRSVYAGRGLAR